MPQGSVLGLLLFLIYIAIDDVIRVPLSVGSKLVLYAYYTERLTARRTTQMLQRDINTIHNWVHNNSLTFNISKCKNMLISHKRQGSCDPPDLLLDDLILERVEGFKYLGVILTSDLLWSSHVESICTKSRKLLGLLYHGSYCTSMPNHQHYYNFIIP